MRRYGGVNMKSITLALLLLLGNYSVGAVETIDIAQVEKAHYFDFLQGNWSYQFEQGKGTAQYERDSHTGAVIGTINGEINNSKFTGKSLTFFSKEKGWQRRWIDTLGNVLQGEVQLNDYEPAKGKALVSYVKFGDMYIKHIWYNISASRFETDLLMSKDGEQYQLVRRMPYIKQQ